MMMESYDFYGMPWFLILCFLMECHQMFWNATESCGIVRTVSIDLLHKLKQSCQRPTLTHDGLAGHEEGLPFIPRRSMVIIQSMRSLRTVPSQVFGQSFFQIRAVEPRVVAFHGTGVARPRAEMLRCWEFKKGKADGQGHL